MAVVLGPAGDPELFSTAVSPPPAHQPQGVHQEGGMLDHLQHHCREPCTDTGTLRTRLSLLLG